MSAIHSLTKDSTLVRWYVMRAFQREKQAEEALNAKGLDFFIPKQYAIRIYHGVKTKRLVPAIPSIVFVHASFDDIFQFKKQHEFLQFVTWGKSSGMEYLVVPDNQMDDFIKVASHYDERMIFHTLDEINIQQGTRVRIHGGKFDNVKGVFMKLRGRRNRRLVVVLDGVMAASVEVEPDLIEVID